MSVLVSLNEQLEQLKNCGDTVSFHQNILGFCCVCVCALCSFAVAENGVIEWVVLSAYHVTVLVIAARGSRGFLP